jgi:hypothetical protein
VNRLAIVPCLVIASYVAVASYIASSTVSYIVYELRRPSVGFKIPTTVSTHGQAYKGSSSRTKQTSLVHPSNEVPNKPLAITEKPAAAVSPETPYHESTWVKVLLPARVHDSPSVDTPIAIFIRLEHRSASRGTGKTGSKSSNRVLRNPGGSIENT